MSSIRKYAFVKEDKLYISVKGVETQITKDGSYTWSMENSHREEFELKRNILEPSGNF